MSEDSSEGAHGCYFASKILESVQPCINDANNVVCGINGLGVAEVSKSPRLSGGSYSHFETVKLTQERNGTWDGDSNGITAQKTSTSLYAQHHCASSHTKSSAASFSDRRSLSFHLPPFKTLNDMPRTLSFPNLEHSKTEPLPPGCSPSEICAPSLDGSLSVLLGGLAPLTPPHEGISAFVPIDYDHSTHSESCVDSTSQPETTLHDSRQRQEIRDRRAQGITLPQPLNMEGHSQLRMLPWIENASQAILASLNSTLPRDVVQVISQTLPSQARDSRSRPTFEDVLEILQSEMDASPYITITHAVQQARVMEELPKTPPSTPNVRQEINDYFGGDQTIFTHAAVVPIYHSHDRIDTDTAGRIAHHIAAPNSIQVSILERYIPPTMPQEIDDFFSVSTRSYLVDRLSELSTAGSLLLIYPTRNGGNAFTRRYLGPILDPYLRQFIMLNSLTSAAAALLGRMTAVNHMIDFEEMKIRLATLCQNLNRRSAARGQKTAFNVVHSELSNIILDRSIWMNWYIEQEQPRLKQNLVEYHQSGGRMPEGQGNREITVSMLVRDLIDGIKKSQEPAADADIEVGVFLITRNSL